MNFFISGNRDVKNAYLAALVSAGHTRVPTIEQSQVVFSDCEPTIPFQRYKYDALTKNKPIFIIPHTPYAWWLWDRWVKPCRAKTMFVMAPAGVTGTRLYNYPNPVVNTGFTRCPIKVFQPTYGARVLFAPVRPLKSDRMWPHPADKKFHHEALTWLADHHKYFDSVTVNYFISMEASELQRYSNIVNFHFVNVEKTYGKSSKLGARTVLKSLQDIDIVVSANTFGFVSIASGKPTVLFGHYQDTDNDFHSSTGGGKHYNLYKHFYEFPIHLPDLNLPAFLRLRESDAPIKEWKRNNIGTPFDPELFITTVHRNI